MLEGWDPLLIRAVKEFKTVLNWRVTEASVPTFFFWTFNAILSRLILPSI